jgi:hypothetical protein
MSLPPHGGAMGCAWQPCSVMRDGVCRRTLRSTSALCPDPARLLGRVRSLRCIGRTFLMVPVCCPSPDPGPHGRLKMCSPAVAEDGLRGP